MLDGTKWLFLAGWLAFIGVRLVGVVRVRRGKQGEERGADRRQLAVEKPLMFLQFLGMQVLPLIYLLTPWLGAADCRLPARVRTAATAAGAAAMMGALWLLWRSHADLGRNWSSTVEIKERQSLVTGGVYRLIRHPMYAAHWLWALAQLLLLENWVAGPAFLVSFLPLYLLRVPREEQAMEEHFGAEYRAYMQRTGRVIPRWGR